MSDFKPIPSRREPSVVPSPEKARVGFSPVEPSATDRAGAEEKTATEERIFEAALRVFAQKGKDGARMQEIADAAQINKAMLNYYFRSKDRLYAQVFHYVFLRFDRAFFEAVEKAGEKSFSAALESFIDHYIQFISHHTDVLRLMVSEFLAGGAVIKAEMRDLFAPGSAPPQRFARMIDAAVEAGEIAPVEPRHFVVTLISGCLFPFIAFPVVSSLIPEAMDDYEGFLEDRKRHLLAVLLRGIEPRTEGSR